MVIVNPSDQVPEEGCNRIGNFPHGILKNPDALALDVGAKGETLPFASKKAEYIADFDSRSLEICEDVEPFANFNSPYRGYLNKKKDDPDPDPDDPNLAWIVGMNLAHRYNETSFQKLGFCGFCLKSIRSDNPNCNAGFHFIWTSDMESISWSLTSPSAPKVIDVTGVQEPSG